MEKNIPELSKLELNQKNVMELLLKAKPSQKTQSITRANFYAKESSRQAPILPLDKDVILSHSYLVRYWLGQIQDLHHQHPVLKPEAGIINYKGQPWTNDYRPLFSLYYLATATHQMPFFEDGRNGSEARRLDIFYKTGLRPTYSPSDPRFNIKDAKKALSDLGVTIED